MPLVNVTPRTVAWAALLCCLVLAALAAAETVTLPAEAPARRTVALQEVWRLGGDDENDPLLGLVTGGAVDDQGRVYLVDRQLSQILVIAADGRLVATLGREGDGPGELRSPHGVFVTATGVGVVQGFPAKITYLAPDGTPAGEARLGGEASEGGFHFVRRIAHVQDLLVGATGRGAFDMDKGTNTTTSSLGVMDMQGTFRTTFAEHVQEQNFQRFEFDETKNWAEHSAWCVSPQGLIYSAAARDRWAINVRDLAGNLVRTCERPFTPRRRTAEDKAEVGSDMRIIMNGRRVEPEITALDTDEAIAGLEAAADGRVFVVSSWDRRARLDKGTAGRYDVLSPEGQLVEQLTLTFPEFDPEHDALVWLDGTRFLVIRNFEDANAAMDGGDGGDEEADLGDAEPLEVVLVRVSG
ncbi:MAG: hypothetical protein IH621_00530 [Krumholzibacteria bacterium]|nr:hypothetical protein [Candidatus Krumholzibacteria bacterium]